MDPFAGHGVLYEQGSAIALYEDWNQLAVQILRGHDSWEDGVVNLVNQNFQETTPPNHTLLRGSGSPTMSPRESATPRSPANPRLVSNPRELLDTSAGSTQARSPRLVNRSPRPAWTPGGVNRVGGSNNSLQRSPLIAYDGNQFVASSRVGHDGSPILWNPALSPRVHSKQAHRPQMQAQWTPQQVPKQTAPRTLGSIGVPSRRPATQRVQTGMSSPQEVPQQPAWRPQHADQSAGYPSSSAPMAYPHPSVPHRRQSQEQPPSPSFKSKQADDTDLDGTMSQTFAAITARLRSGRNPRIEQQRGDRKDGNPRPRTPPAWSANYQMRE